MNARILTVILLVVYLIIAWFTGSLLKLEGSDLWILRGLLALVGIIAAAVVWWYLGRSAQSAGAGQAVDKTDDLELLLRAAEQKLRSSKLGRAARISSLPVVVFLGDRDAAKTSVITQSGAEPELLAGQVYGDNTIVPTEAANCWFARGQVFIEVGGRLLGGAGAWSQLIRGLKPQRLAFLRGAKNAARAAVICVPADVFLQPNASELTEALARKVRARLDEVASRLGIRLPVYVLFTKTDKVPFFTDYVHNFSEAEASEVIGATLPLDREQGAAVYAERASERIGESFRKLVHAMAAHRNELLAREHNAAKLGNVYEFPRELGKLRAAMVKFLVDVCRPSQLRTAPFLRGFYFSGVRPVVLDDRSEQPLAAAQPAAGGGDVGATRIFRAGDLGAARERPAPRTGGRRVPQWTFVSHFFSDVLLKDAVAQGASGASVKTSALRRVSLAAVLLVLFIAAVGMTVSYFGNRALEQKVLDQAKAATASVQNPKTLETLTRLDGLRQALEELRANEEKGAPWRLRWTLYSGSDVLAEGKKQYFKLFDRVLLRPAQESMVTLLKSLPSAPTPASDYSGPYDTLKAYLITTSNHDQSTEMFLSPILLGRWSKDAEAPTEIAELAKEQFDYYAGELKTANPLSAENDREAISNTRKYLAQFDPVERVYRAMLAEAAQKNPAVRLSTRYPKSEEVVASNYEVSGAFTKGGFLSMSASLKNADRFFAGEEWVLGDRGAAGVDASKLEPTLRARYTTDFIQEWRTLLADKSRIVAYADPGDAAKKLNRLAGNQSPLLGLLSLVSENTAVDSEEIKKAFQPVQLVTPPGSSEKLIGESNSPYMGALLALQAALEQVANAPPGDGREPLVTQAATKASEAKVLTRQLAQNFRPDPERRIDAAVQKLLEDPISNAEVLVRGAGPAELNGKGRAFCGQVQETMLKYPFTPTATNEATQQDLALLFDPKQGALWSFYKNTLSKVLIKQGNQYVDEPSSSVRATPAFREYWNRVAIFTDVMFPANPKQKGLAVTLKLVPNKSVNNVRFSVEGKNLSSNGSNPSPMQFTWAGGTQPVTLNARIGNSDMLFGRYEGFWGLFRFFGDSENWSLGTPTTFERIVRQGRQGAPLTFQDGTPMSLKFELDSGPSPIFKRGFMAGLRCMSEIARP